MNAAATGGSAPIDGDGALDAARMYAILNDQQRSVESQMGGFVPAIMLTWAVVWLLGFGALWSIDGLGSGAGLPLGAAITVFCVLLAIGIAISTWLGIRSSRGIRGASASAFTGAVYGITWWVGSLGIAAFGGALNAGGMSAELANLFYPTAYVMFAGIMFVVAGAIWRAVPSVVLGVWTVLVAAVAPYFGSPTHFLVLAIGGGGGFLVVGIVSLVRARRARALATASLTAGAPSRG